MCSSDLSNVQGQTSQHGYSEQKSVDLSQLSFTFDLNSASGVASAFNGFFQSFSKLSISPNDSVARQGVLDQAGAVATSFRQAASGISASGTRADNQIKDTLQKINDLVGRLRDINATRREDAGSKNDAGLEASVYATLEELSSYTSVQALRQDDGTITVLLGGQVSALMGVTQNRLAADFSSPRTAVRDAYGKDVTSILSGGKIGALLDFRNHDLPSYRADLDSLAQNFAEKINTALAAGVDKNGATPAVDLFSFNGAVGAAYTMAVTNITVDQIAAASPTAPGGNGTALAIARLSSQPLVNGFTPTQVFGNLSARIGRDLSAAQDSENTQLDMLEQALSLRSQASAVSLDEEAAQLIQVQRAYQAAGKLVGVLQEMTQTLIDLIR